MELAYKEVTKGVTMGMDSIIRIKLLCQVLPWLHQGSPFLAHSRRCWSQVPASSVSAPASPVPPQGTCSWGPPSVHEGSSALGSAGPHHAKCQTTRVPATRGHEVCEERCFSQQGVREKTRKVTGRASRPWGPGGRCEKSCL